MYRILSTDQYHKWFSDQTLKTQGQVQARLERIIDHNHFGDAKNLGTDLAELKWKNGLRVYFSIVRDDNGEFILLLIGGNKNSQRRDIQRAKKLLTELRK